MQNPSLFWANFGRGLTVGLNFGRGRGPGRSLIILFINPAKLFYKY